MPLNGASLCPQHYISYNADTRLLNLYPNLLVLEDADVADPARFVKKTLETEYHIRIIDELELVRQVYMRVCPSAMRLPHLCSRWVEKAVRSRGQ